jgi:quercetin dioxygenase-like cupin family protein
MLLTRSGLLVLLSLTLVLAATNQRQHTSTGAIIGLNEGEKFFFDKNRPLLLKVDPISSGSSHLVVGYEELPPGTAIPVHKHLMDEEVLFLHQGEATVTLGDVKQVVKQGATIYIPLGVWVGVENTGKGTASVLFIFPQPGFDEYVRQGASRAGEPEKKLTDKEYRELDAKYHIVYRD